MMIITIMIKEHGLIILFVIHNHKQDLMSLPPHGTLIQLQTLKLEMISGITLLSLDGTQTKVLGLEVTYGCMKSLHKQHYHSKAKHM